jgi:DNA topoisomerase IA
MSRVEFRTKFDLLAGISLSPALRDQIDAAIAELPVSASCEHLFGLILSSPQSA